MAAEARTAGNRARAAGSATVRAMPSFEQLTLRTARLRLRPMVKADAAALLAIFGDAVVMRYWSNPAWTSMTQAHAFLSRDRQAMRSGEYIRLGLERIDQAGIIGTCTLFNLVAQCRRAEVGYSLARAAWQQGYMDEALRALLDHGFSTMALHRVEADIDPRNLASARSLERLGFVKEGHLRERWIVDGEVSDAALYGLLAVQWLHRTVAAPAGRGQTEKQEQGVSPPRTVEP
jgi:RimJ/RimL family protein N-acetyltransferase